MKTKEELEKKFDEKFCEFKNEMSLNELKQFIFETIIPEVLKSVIDRPFLSEADDLYREGYDDCISDIKQKAKELY